MDRNYLLSQKLGHRHGLKLELIVLPVSDVDRAKGLCEVLRSCLDVDCTAQEYRAVRFTPPDRVPDHLSVAGWLPRLGSPQDLVSGVEQVDAVPADSCGYLSNRNIGFSSCSHMTDYRDSRPGPTVNGVARTGTGGAVNPR
ncbi:hypothetical protein [Streptomyces sp. NPDC047009]|uniref:hypothetical protein n=1 Tax=Streptomyces sp. NPDC047009 TaxID=3154496 RepID=UPI0033C03473